MAHEPLPTIVEFLAHHAKPKLKVRSYVEDKRMMEKKKIATKLENLKSP